MPGLSWRMGLTNYDIVVDRTKSRYRPKASPYQIDNSVNLAGEVLDRLTVTDSLYSQKRSEYIGKNIRDRTVFAGNW